MNSCSNELHTEKYDHDHEIVYDGYATKLDQQVNISGIQSTSHGDLSPELLSKLWDINILDAKRTHSTTSHDHIRILGSLDCRVKTMTHQRVYK